MNYKSEEEFLKDYDSSKFEKLSMTTDILLLSVSDEKQDNYRKTDNKNGSITFSPSIRASESNSVLMLFNSLL